MSKYFKFALIALLALLFFGWVGSMQFAEKEPKLKANQKVAPDFKLKSIRGEEISLSSFKGKFVYIKFWASWCGDCIKEVVPQRHLEESLKEDTSIVFVNVSVDGDAEAWKRAVERNKLQAVELLSLKGKEGDINSLYHVDAIPLYVTVGKDGKVMEEDAPKPSEIDAQYFKE